LKTQKPDARDRIAWCRPPAMLMACWLAPDQTRSAASTLPPAINAEASYMCGNTGLSVDSNP
jgi:hypothetical protein